MTSFARGTSPCASYLLSSVFNGWMFSGDRVGVLYHGDCQLWPFRVHRGGSYTLLKLPGRRTHPIGRENKRLRALFCPVIQIHCLAMCVIPIHPGSRLPNTCKLTNLHHLEVSPPEYMSEWHPSCKGKCLGKWDNTYEKCMLHTQDNRSLRDIHCYYISNHVWLLHF